MPIPRCFHWVWLGDEPLPAQYREWMEGWGRMHGGWEHRLWTDSNRPTLRNEACFVRATVPAQRADILRYEVVHRFGGVYLDVDMECLKSIAGLLDGVEAFAAEEQPGELAIGIIGAVPGHPWLADVIAQLPASMEQHSSILRATGPGHLTAVTSGHPEVTIFPQETFYPYLAHEPSRASGPFPSAYAVHRWHGSWVAPEDKFLEDFPRELEHQLRSLLPKGVRVLTLAEGINLHLGERPILPFANREGFWGNPDDSDAALAELDRLRARGWSWLVVLEDAYWWFDFYAEFMSTVQQRAAATHRGRGFIAFEFAGR
jgi:Glycosyltransferase sugar-binding region containing DXD motif